MTAMHMACNQDKTINFDNVKEFKTQIHCIPQRVYSQLVLRRIDWSQYLHGSRIMHVLELGAHITDGQLYTACLPACADEILVWDPPNMPDESSRPKPLSVLTSADYM